MQYLDSGSREEQQALAYWLQQVLDDSVSELRIQSGYFSFSALGLFVTALERLAKSGGPVSIVLGSNDRGTTADDVVSLLDIIKVPRPGAKVGIASFSGGLYHPKVYHVRRADGHSAAYVGSSNLTPFGLSLNVEAGITLDSREGDSVDVLQRIADEVDYWFAGPRAGLTVVNSIDEVDALRAEGVLGDTRIPTTTVTGRLPTAKTAAPGLQPLYRLPPIKGVMPSPAPLVSTPNKAFLMLLQRTDMGYGQTTKGTSARSPEIFIPLAARDYDPDFWGWRKQFTADPKHPGKYDRTNVRFRLGTQVVSVNMMTWPDKSDFRVRSSSLRAAGTPGDLLYIEQLPSGSPEDYYVEVVPQGSNLFVDLRPYCSNQVKNSEKRWGYL